MGMRWDMLANTYDAFCHDETIRRRKLDEEAEAFEPLEREDVIDVAFLSKRGLRLVFREGNETIQGIAGAPRFY